MWDEFSITIFLLYSNIVNLFTLLLSANMWCTNWRTDTASYTDTSPHLKACMHFYSHSDPRPFKPRPIRGRLVFAPHQEHEREGRFGEFVVALYVGPRATFRPLREDASRRRGKQFAFSLLGVSLLVSPKISPNDGEREAKFHPLDDSLRRPQNITG